MLESNKVSFSLELNVPKINLSQARDKKKMETPHR